MCLCVHACKCIICKKTEREGIAWKHNIMKCYWKKHLGKQRIFFQGLFLVVVGHSVGWLVFEGKD